MQMWKQNRTLFEYFRFMGYLMMIVGVYLLVGGIGDYAEPIPPRTTDLHRGNGHGCLQRGSQFLTTT